MAEPEVVVVGAGAAGIGAGLELSERGVPFVILEASKRVGGRAYTDKASLPAPWDQGCHWLHCADVNPLVAWADQLGSTYVKEKRGRNYAIWTKDRFARADELDEARRSTLAAHAAIDASARQKRDVPLSDVLPDAGRWGAGVRSLLQALAGDDPERVSTVGYADYADTDVNWPVFSGYGDLIAKMAAGLPVRLATPVAAIDGKAGTVKVETNGGTIEAKAAIVTASTNVLRSGAIRFAPGVASAVLDRIADVPCGAYEKVAFALRRLPCEVRGKLFCTIDPDGSPAVDFQIMASDPPLMIAHMAGTVARDLHARGRQAMIAFAADRLALAFGGEIRQDIVGVATTDWTANPFVQGSYSHARPGTAHRRHEMIAMNDGNVVFAGEAFSAHWQATAHGAYQSGRDVAGRLAGFLNGKC